MRNKDEKKISKLCKHLSMFSGGVCKTQHFDGVLGKKPNRNYSIAIRDNKL